MEFCVLHAARIPLRALLLREQFETAWKTQLPTTDLKKDFQDEENNIFGLGVFSGELESWALIGNEGF